MQCPGHWEGHLLVGKAGRSAIATLVARTTRYTILVKVNDRTTTAVCGARGECSMPAETLRRGLTWDQGKEMTGHATFSVASGVKVYFCDPSSPWQRGSNENTNGLLRQYFPKALTSRATSNRRSMPWPTSSTDDLDKLSAG